MLSQKVKITLVLRVHQKGSSLLRANQEDGGRGLVWVIFFELILVLRSRHIYNGEEQRAAGRGGSNIEGERHRGEL